MRKFDYSIVRNPEIFQQNRLKAHSDHEFFSNESAVEEGKSDFKYSLNGVWKFAYARNYNAAIKDFYEGAYDCHAWDEIHVPAHIQVEGYDVPQYANTQYPWEGHDNPRPGEIPEYFNPVASYVKYFELPEEIVGKPVYISFQGVESGMALWLNGTYVGYSEDSFTPSEFELTEYLKEGENKLAVMVFKWTAGSWCEDQDFFRFSGIFRDVYLYTIPEVHVQDMKIQTLLDDTYQEASLVLDLSATKVGSYSMELRDGEETVIRGNGELAEMTHIAVPIHGPNLWSAEEPNLYDLIIQIFDENMELQEIIKERVGFRRFELIDHIMCLNGKRIVFKGTNRHEFCSSTGRVLPDEVIRQDLINMKRNNINAIRTSHYPNKTAFYRMCDEYGFYVIDETNLETHGTWDAILSGFETMDFMLPGKRKEFEKLVLDRANSMYQRDKNHACILIWSCGNESFGGKDINEMSKFFHREDPNRLVHYEGVYHDPFAPLDYTDTSDMVTTMYTPAADIARYLKEHREKPFIECEYTHSMGNSNGAMHKYTELAYEEPLYQGGFIWDYIDQSMTLRDRYGVEYQGYGGDFGDRPSDYSFSGNGIAYGGESRESSPKMQEVKYNYQNIVAKVTDQEVVIENRNLFLNTSEFDCVVLLEKEEKLMKKAILVTDVAPLSEGTYPLPFDVPIDRGEYIVTVSFRLKEDTLWADRGHEVAYGQTAVGTYEKKAKSTKKVTVVEGWHNIGVRGDEFEVIFSRIHGGLISYKYGGMQMLKSIPKPNFWRAMTENDIANLLPFRAGQWKLASMWPTIKYNDGLRMTNYEITKQEDHVEVEYTYHLPTTPAKDCKLKYDVYGDGEVQVTMTLPPSAEVGELPEYGVVFAMDSDFDHLKWYGRGEAETYPDRNHAKLGVYRNKVSDNMARYLVPQECGNKQDVRYASVTNNRGRGLLFRCNQLGFSALPYSVHELDNATHSVELPQPHFTYIRVGKQMGIAGDDTWGAKTHPEYMLDNSKEMKISFSFQGL